VAIIRRIFFYWQFISAFVLPVWVLVGRGIVRAGTGWDFVLYLVLCPILFVLLIVVATLTAGRKRVRAERAVAWRDVALQAPLHAAVIVYGAVASDLLAVLVVLLAVVVFWNAVWQFFGDLRNRVTEAFSLGPIDAGDYPATTPPTVRSTPASEAPSDSPQAGRVIIVNPDGTREELPRTDG
jgi:hypothetical protein